jgi:hypothetical protein
MTMLHIMLVDGTAYCRLSALVALGGLGRYLTSNIYTATHDILGHEIRAKPFGIVSNLKSRVIYSGLERSIFQQSAV